MVSPRIMSFSKGLNKCYILLTVPSPSIICDKSNGIVKSTKIEEDSKSAIIEVLPPPAADPIAGRYRLVKTENFDEFMKKLGVGLVKRKLANSVSPMNVIILNDDGESYFYPICTHEFQLKIYS